MSRILTLTTDFGTADGFVGAMKGRIIALAPQLRLVDITHELPPQGVLPGAWCLRRAVPQYPHGTVHLAVVDPGVGSARSGIVIETQHYRFVGPDNGLLSLAAGDDHIERVVEISEEDPRWRKSTSFDGLTLFAPVAALVAAGLPLDEVGPDAEDIVTLPEPPAHRQGNTIEGRVVLFDHFGNAATNIPGDWLRDQPVERVLIADGNLLARFCTHYAELAGGNRLGALINSDGRLELAVFGGSARERARLKPGDTVRVLLRPPR